MSVEGPGISCSKAQRELSQSIDESMTPESRRRIEQHLSACPTCRVFSESLTNTVHLLNAWDPYELPKGFSERLMVRLSKSLERVEIKGASATVPLGISDQLVNLGSHVVHFWTDESEFQVGIDFLKPAFRNTKDHCVVFGHEEANSKVLAMLQKAGFEPESLLTEQRLTVLPREQMVDLTISSISRVFEQAVLAGATSIRFLGNLSGGQDKWPEGNQNDVLELECKVTSLAALFPCVVLCMYDAAAVPSSMLLKGGFGTHPHVIWRKHLTENPYYLPEERFMNSLHCHP
jgi:hypothetical protein